MFKFVWWGIVMWILTKHCLFLNPRSGSVGERETEGGGICGRKGKHIRRRRKVKISSKENVELF